MAVLTFQFREQFTYKEQNKENSLDTECVKLFKDYWKVLAMNEQNFK